MRSTAKRETATDYTPSEDDHVTTQGVKGEAGAMGYFGLTYLEAQHRPCRTELRPIEPLTSPHAWL